MTHTKKFEAFFPIGTILGSGHGPKTSLGSTHIDKQLLLFKFCSFFSPSYSPGGLWADLGHIGQNAKP